jgi:hypothetical protein
MQFAQIALRQVGSSPAGVAGGISVAHSASCGFTERRRPARRLTGPVTAPSRRSPPPDSPPSSAHSVGLRFPFVNPGFRSPAKRDRFTLGFMRVARVAGLPFLRLRRNHSRKTKLEKLAFRPDAARFPKQMSPKGPNSSSPWRIKFRKGRAFPYKEAGAARLRWRPTQTDDPLPR